MQYVENEDLSSEYMSLKLKVRWCNPQDAGPSGHSQWLLHCQE